MAKQRRTPASYPQSPPGQCFKAAVFGKTTTLYRFWDESEQHALESHLVLHYGHGFARRQRSHLRHKNWTCGICGKPLWQFDSIVAHNISKGGFVAHFLDTPEAWVRLPYVCRLVFGAKV